MSVPRVLFHVTLFFCVSEGSGLGGGDGPCHRTERKTHQGEKLHHPWYLGCVDNSAEALIQTLSPFVVQEEDALSYVAGFTVANDVSARDWQMKRNGNQWLLGKTFDSFCPLGPALVTSDAVSGEWERESTVGRQKGDVKGSLICLLEASLSSQAAIQ